MSCNLLEFEGFKPNFGILSSCTYVRVATADRVDAYLQIGIFQAVCMYELQPIAALQDDIKDYLSSCVHVRVATPCLR